MFWLYVFGIIVVLSAALWWRARDSSFGSGKGGWAHTGDQGLADPHAARQAAYNNHRQQGGGMSGGPSL